MMWGLAPQRTCARQMRIVGTSSQFVPVVVILSAPIICLSSSGLGKDSGGGQGGWGWDGGWGGRGAGMGMRGGGAGREEGHVWELVGFESTVNRTR